MKAEFLGRGKHMTKLAWMVNEGRSGIQASEHDTMSAVLLKGGHDRHIDFQPREKCDQSRVSFYFYYFF